LALPAYFNTLASTGQPLADVRRFLREARRLDTLRHVTRVAAVGRRLARRFQLSLAQSDLACTAHDLAAVVPARSIVDAAEDLGLDLTPADYAIPQVVHGPVAAAVLNQALQVDDQAVLDAVAYHTTLRAGAAPLEQLVFIADKLAYDPTTPAVGFHPRLMEARDTASLPELCWNYLDWAVREGPRLGWRLHPNLVAAEAELRPTRARP
jgi:predicted HD superfamily hydrolase involved in NAD metabolism